MGDLAINQIKAGMKLCDDVRDHRGKVLLPNGTELTEKHLRILKMWGINSVDIEGAGADSPGEQAGGSSLTDKERDLLCEEVESRFKHCDLSDPIMQSLFEVAKNHLIKNHFQ